MKPFLVYLLQCADGSFYAGHTDDIDKRLLQHSEGAVGFTASRKPVALRWTGEFESRDGALAFERQIKGWSRAKKEALIAGDWERIKQLSRAGGPSTSSGRTGLEEGPSTGSGRTELEEGPSTGSGRTGLEESPSTSSGRAGLEEGPSTGSGRTGGGMQS